MTAAAAALCMGPASLAAGCTEPHFPSEAAVAPSEAGAEEPDGPREATDPRWQQWVGRYAARTIVHGIDDFLRPTSQELSLVVIEPRGDQLVLEQQLCRLEGSWSHALLDGSGSLDPQQAIFLHDYESVSFAAEMVPKETGFETNPARYQIGFDPEPPRACVAARTAAGAQPWLSGDCSCPRHTDEVPTSASDCRVTDPELDGQPGATVHAALNGERVEYHVAQQVEIRYTDGYRIADRLFASVEASESHTVFGCTVPELSDDCTIGTATICPPEHNEIVFVPLADDDYDCARIVKERDGLFPGAIPQFPNGCAAGY